MIMYLSYQIGYRILLCRAVTGSSFSKRALWTNDEDFYYNFKRNLGINGIDLAATKADLLDRSILMETERIEIAETTLKINTSKIKVWPKSTSYLSRRLNSIRTNLREKGIEIRTGDKDSQDKRLITISKVPSVASVPSKPDNLSTNQAEKVDGTENNDNMPSKVPSTNNEGIQAQNTDSRQHDSIDDTLHNFGGGAGGGSRSINNISRIHPHSDIWKCDCCNLTGDKWFMIEHPCKNNKKTIKKMENDE